MKIEDIAVWEAFQGVAVQGGFSKAAHALKLTVPQVSKRIAKLEAELGVRLFQRSTRVVSLTDEGRALLPKVAALLEDLAGIETSFESKERLSGTIRMTCVPFVAHRLLTPVIREFKKKHPDVRFELELSEGFLNLVESGIDLAIRIHEQPDDSSLVYRKLASNRLVLCASPAYLKRKKSTPSKPTDLRNHDVLMLDIHRECRFVKSAQALGELVKPQSITCENGAFLTQLALDGFGILVRSVWDVQEHLRRGELVQVLPNVPLESFGNIYAVIPSRRFLSFRVRGFLDLVVQESAGWN